MRKIFITLALLSSTVILSGCFWQQTPSNEGWQKLSETGSSVEPPRIKYETYTVEMTQSGFSPSSLTISIGDSVKFITMDDGSYWPASAMHPTHKVYPGSDIKKCGTSEESGIFDACKWLSRGQSFIFTFNQAGTWGYHDHLNAKLFGKIIVNNRPGSSVISTGSVMYFPGSKDYRGYLAKSGQPGKRPGLVLIHEWWGLNDNIKKLAEDFAKQWYVVLAVDLYGKPATTDQQIAMQMAGDVSKNEALAFQNLGYAVEFLRSNPDVDPKKLWSVGWCFWWGWAYQMAKNNLWTRASVMYYGRFNPSDDLKMMRSQILGHFGEKDTSITIDSVTEFQAKLKTLSGSTSMVYIYPNAGHGFANESGATYDKVAAETAWQRTIDFLAKNVMMQQ